MAQTVCVLLGEEDRKRLAAIIGDRNRPQKHVQRARIVHLSAEHLPVLAVARQTGASRPAVWRWQQRFAEESVDGLLRDKTRKPGKQPLPAATVAKILALPCGEPPRGATHSTGRMVPRPSASACARCSASGKRTICNLTGSAPSRRPPTRPLSKRVEDVVGLYINPPIHAVVVSIDEKSQIQALDRSARPAPETRQMRHHDP